MNLSSEYTSDSMMETTANNTTTQSSNERNVSCTEHIRCYCTELKSSNKYFSWNYCAEAFFFKVFLPFNDIISDFLVAEKLYRSKNELVSRWFTFYSYYFIACPGFMFLLGAINFLQNGYMTRCGCKGSLLPFLVLVCVLCLEGLFLPYANPKFLLPAAVFVSSIILFVGLIEVLFHGPYMRKLSILVTGYEGRFESAPQLLMHLVLLIAGEEYFYTSELDIYGLLTSLAMLGKDLAENILMNGQQDYTSKSFPDKIVSMAKIFPVILLTAIFRLGTLALAINHIFVLKTGLLLLVPLKLMLVLPPALTLLCLRSFSEQIKELTVVDCFLGIVGELSAFTTWGKLKHDGCRWIHLGFTLYFGVLFGSYCLWIVFNPPSIHADLYAIVFLCCGWMAFPLFISQIFFISLASADPDTTETGKTNENFSNKGIDFKMYLI